MIWVFVFGFVLGMLAMLAMGAAALLYFVKQLNRKRERAESKANSLQSNRDLDPQQSLDFAFNKQGVVWVLEMNESMKNWMAAERLPKEQKRRKDVLEVTPVRRFGRIKHNKLILSDVDGGSQITVQLKGCTIEAVSATGLSTRKWAKRYPIKIESKTSVYKGSRVFYIYLETSWEKESWCKAFRLASCEDQDKITWFIKLKEEFRCYLTSLSTEYPSFMKPSAGFIFDTQDKGNKADGSSSKVRMFWKKFARRTSNKGTLTNPSTREEGKVGERARPSQDLQQGASLGKSIFPAKKNPVNIQEDNSVSTFSRSGSHSSHISGASDVESEDKFHADEGTLSWNLLISRFFFDAKHNVGMRNSIQARIQRTLTNIRTPSYIGELICTNVDVGNLPPVINGIRVLPMEMNNVWAFEVDVEYCGGVVLDVETRLEVQDLQKGIVDTSLQQTSVDDVSSDLLEGFEYFGKQLNLPVEYIDAQDQKSGADTKSDGSRGSRGTVTASNNVSKWKSILKSIAQQVSQVPLSLSIRVASLRGTLRLHIKPPPSDQLWFGFTSMPDIEFDLASSVGDHKISSGHVALYLISRFKTAIRETMVLPNCESLCIPWMVAEKDDWVPRKVAPFMWLNQEGASDHDRAHEAFSFRPGEANHKAESNRGASNNQSDSNHQKQKADTESVAASAASTSSTIIPIQSSKSLQELKTPLLGSNETQEDRGHIPGSHSPARSSNASEDDELKIKKTGRRARMLDLGKRMGEKFEEKRRHIEEKGRNIVDKMRGP